MPHREELLLVSKGNLFHRLGLRFSQREASKHIGGSHSVNFDMLFGDVTVLFATGCAAAFSVLGSQTFW